MTDWERKLEWSASILYTCCTCNTRHSHDVDWFDPPFATMANIGSTLVLSLVLVIWNSTSFIWIWTSSYLWCYFKFYFCFHVFPDVTYVPFQFPSVIFQILDVPVGASDRQGSNFESCVWRTVSSQSSHHPQEVLLAQFSLYVHKGGLKPNSFHFCTCWILVNLCWIKLLSIYLRRGSPLGFIKSIVHCHCHLYTRLAVLVQFLVQLFFAIPLVTVSGSACQKTCQTIWKHKCGGAIVRLF